MGKRNERDADGPQLELVQGEGQPDDSWREHVRSQIYANGDTGTFSQGQIIVPPAPATNGQEADDAAEQDATDEFFDQLDENGGVAAGIAASAETGAAAMPGSAHLPTDPAFVTRQVAALATRPLDFQDHRPTCREV
jgi:hypothetical protein